MAKKAEPDEGIVVGDTTEVIDESLETAASDQVFSLPSVKDKMLEKVKIVIRNQSDETTGHEFVGINDFMMSIRREQVTEVPRYVYNHLKNTKGLKIVRDGEVMKEVPFNRFIVELVED